MGWSDGGAFCEDHAQEVVWYAEEDCAFDEVDDCLCDEEEAKDRARMLRVDFDGHGVVTDCQFEVVEFVIGESSVEEGFEVVGVVLQ